jgi:hypothetical protein
VYHAYICSIHTCISAQATNQLGHSSLGSAGPKQISHPQHMVHGVVIQVGADCTSQVTNHRWQLQRLCSAGHHGVKDNSHAECQRVPTNSQSQSISRAVQIATLPYRCHQQMKGKRVLIARGLPGGSILPAQPRVVCPAMGKWHFIAFRPLTRHRHSAAKRAAPAKSPSRHADRQDWQHVEAPWRK